jgi:hypothetical protein
VPSLTPQQMERKLGSLFDDFAETRDDAEALAAFAEIQPAPELVTQVMRMIMIHDHDHDDDDDDDDFRGGELKSLPSPLAPSRSRLTFVLVPYLRWCSGGLTLVL